jgi:protein involved in ribonucleotide reduction
VSITIVYFSNYSGNTKRFAEKINENAIPIPIKSSDSEPLIMHNPYVLFVPTYGSGSDTHAIPRQVRRFLNNRNNREKLQGVVGFGNTNFGEDFCKAAHIISSKAGVPLVARIEIFGTQDDVIEVKNRLEILYGE